MATVVQTITITCATKAEQTTAQLAVQAWVATNPQTPIQSIVLTNNTPWRVTVTLPSAAWTLQVA